MTTSVLNEKQQTVLQPDEDLMFDLQGFDYDMIRQDFAPVRPLQDGEKFIEQGDAMFMDPNLTDYPDGPSSVGEVLGNVDLVRVVGAKTEIPRYTAGFHVDTEDNAVDTRIVQQKRDAIMELFQKQADFAFLQGLSDETGTNVFKGVFKWLDDNVPSNNIIDCSTFDPSAGDLDGVPANIVLQEAYSKVTGEYVGTSGQWELAVAKHPVWAEWNQVGTFDGAVVQSQWEIMSATDTAGVGVRERIVLPNKIGFRGPPGGGDLRRDITFPTRTNTGFDSDLSDLSGFTDDDDVMYLIPEHNGDFFELHEEGTPHHRMIEKEGFKEKHEYRWRAGVTQGITHKRDSDIAQDAIKLENVTALFDNA